MSIKKELLEELSEQQLKNLAESKGVKFKLNKRQKKYYENWEEKAKLVDYMTSNPEISVSDIEHYIKKQ